MATKVKLLIGKKGTGKTKTIIEGVNKSAETSNGNVVFISSKTSRYNSDIKTTIRMIDTSEFSIKTYNEFFGLICGVVSSNRDITHIYIDSILKIAIDDQMTGLYTFLERLEKVATQNNMSVVLCLSMDEGDAPDFTKKYL
jgi:ABC-type phosphate/phosphonate transport system ATPase subunit